MIDTWVLTAQLATFFESGAGKTLFGPHQGIAIDTSKALQTQFETTVKGFMKYSDFQKDQQFINDFINSNPLTNLKLIRQSAFDDWLRSRGMSESEAVTTYGSGPEVISDMADRIAMISAQAPKIIGWQIELHSLHSTINAEDLQKTLKNISATSIKFQQLMQQSPEMVAGLALDMRNELAPLLTQLSDIADNKLEKLTQERSALEEMVSRERLAIEQFIIQERTAAAVSLNDISKNTVEIVFDELRKTFKSIIAYIISLLLIIFFAPLMLGVWLGKRIAYKKQINN